MKKTYLGLTVLLLALLIFALTACADPDDTTLPLESTSADLDDTSKVTSSSEGGDIASPECTHKMAERVVPPSCTKGYTLHYCQNCDYSFTDSYVDPIGHDYAEKVTPPECLKGGFTTYTCTECNHSYTDQKTEPLGHSYGDWVITKEATSTEKGTKITTCTRCSHKKTESYSVDWNVDASKGLEFTQLGADWYFTGAGTCTDDVIRVPSMTDNGMVIVGVSDITTDASKILLPDTIKYIEAGAFKNCPNLTELTVPKSVEQIGLAIIQNCPNLKTVYFNATHCNNYTYVGTSERGAFSGSDVETVVFGQGMQTVLRRLFKDAKKLTSVTFSDGISTIYYEAFAGCSSLTEVKFGSELSRIGESAFQNTAIKNLVLPDSLTTIDGSAFRGAKLDQDVLVIGENIEKLSEYCFNNAGSVRKLVYAAKNATTDSGMTFFAPFNGMTVGELVIDISVDSLDDFVFGYITGLKNVTIPAHIKVLPASSFIECPDLESVSLGGVREIQNFSFKNCSKLTTLTGMEKVTVLGGSAFEGTAIKSLDLSGLDSLPTYALYNSAVESVVLPAGITEIPDCTFSGSAIKSFVIPASVKVIGENAFSSSALTSISIPANVTEIQSFAFRLCPSLESVVFEGSLASIPSNCFMSCPSLKSVSFQGDVNVIGSHAFSDCHALCEINLPDSLTKIGSNAFSSTGLVNVIISDSVEEIGSDCFSYCKSLSSVTVGSGIKTIPTFCFAYSSVETVTLPEELTGVGNHAFYLCSGLTKINFGSSLQTVGENAFGMCYALTEVKLPETVKTIGRFAFQKCTALTAIDLGSSLESIGDYAFSGCEVLHTVFLPKSLENMKVDKDALSPFNGCPIVIYTDLDTVPSAWYEYFECSIHVGYTYEEYLEAIA